MNLQIINKIDKNASDIFEKMNILQYGQVYYLSVRMLCWFFIYIFKIRNYTIATDMTASIIMVTKDRKVKGIALSIGNPFTSNFIEGKSLCDEILIQIFNIVKNQKEFIQKCSYFDKELEDALRDRLFINNHWDILQYSNILSKY